MFIGIAQPIQMGDGERGVLPGRKVVNAVRPGDSYHWIGVSVCLKTITTGVAFFPSRYFAIWTETGLRVATPVESVTATRHSWVRLRLDKHALGT